MKTIINILKISSEPPSLVYPYPLIPFAAFALAKTSILKFVAALLFVFAYCSASNLWNHINDLEVDIKFGRKNFEFLFKYRYVLILYIFALYFLGALILYFVSFNRYFSLMLYFICFIILWLYSDRLLLGKKIKRFKENYLTEFLTYTIVTPISAVVLWSLYRPISTKGILFAIMVTFLCLSIFVLKDLKDISADTYAGYRTLAVVFNPKILIKLSFILNFVYYIILCIFSLFGVFPITCLLGMATLPIYFYALVSLKRNSWIPSISQEKIIKMYVYSYMISILLFGIGALISFLL